MLAVWLLSKLPNNNDKNGEKGGASNGSNNGQKNGGQPGDEDVDRHDADAADGEEEETGSNKNNKNGQTGTNNGSGSGTGENGGNPGSGSGTGSGNGGGSGTGDGTGKGGSNPGGGNGDPTDADEKKKQNIADKITEIDSSNDWNNFTVLVKGIASDSDLIVDDIFNKIKDKIGGKVYCTSDVLGLKINNNENLINFLGFCDYVESFFHKNDENLRFYFKPGDDVNIFIEGTNDKFCLDKLESLVTIENNNNEGLELDDQGKIKLLGKEWDSKGDIDKIVGFLEGISKMNLGTDFKGLDVTAENDGMFSINGFLFKIFEPDDTNICKPDVLNKGIDVLDKLGKLKKVINNFFKDLEVAQGNFSNDLSTNTDFKFGNYMLSLKQFFSNDVNVCKNFFAALYPDGKYHVKNESGNAGIYRNDGNGEKKVGVLNADLTPDVPKVDTSDAGSKLGSSAESSSSDSSSDSSFDSNANTDEVGKSDQEEDE